MKTSPKSVAAYIASQPAAARAIPTYKLHGRAGLYFAG
jgi:hypothetical protein